MDTSGDPIDYPGDFGNQDSYEPPTDDHSDDEGDELSEVE